MRVRSRWPSTRAPLPLRHRRDAFLTVRSHAEVTFEPGILADEACMAVCKLNNCDGQLGWKLFGSWGTSDGALRRMQLCRSATRCRQ